MLALLGGILLVAASAQAPAAIAADPCAGDPDCTRASAADLFAAADALASEGDLAAAEAILDALTADPDPELRSEARFRLASVRERQGDLGGAVAALRLLLEEKPDAQRARLELSRILALQGHDREARRELRQASAAGLPTDVAWTVRRFSTALNSLKRRGVSVELGVAADSNINRSTSDRYIDTVIAPFELDPDAREQAGIGFGLGGEAFSRDSLLGMTLLTRAGARGDFFLGNKRFNDVQLSLSSGPELTTGIGRFRPALTHERYWYGGDPYSRGYGGSFNWLLSPSTNTQLQLDASVVHQRISKNPLLDGYRYALSLTYDRALTTETTVRMALRGAAFDAVARPESLRQAGVDALVAHVLSIGTVFGQAGYTRTEGLAPFALFGKSRRDDRLDLGLGILAHDLGFGGFAPLVRISYTESRSNLVLYDFRRARLELGLSRAF